MSFETSPYFRPPLAPRRMPLDVPCILHFDGRTISARTHDICYGGIGVLLPPETPEFNPQTLQQVYAEDLGMIGVVMRWRRMTRIGLAFEDPEAVKGQLNAFFRKTGRFPA